MFCMRAPGVKKARTLFGMYQARSSLFHKELGQRRRCYNAATDALSDNADLFFLFCNSRVR